MKPTEVPASATPGDGRANGTSGTSGTPLTAPQLRFCEEYAADPIGVQAYRRAFPGCSYNSARVEASKLLREPNIQAEIEACREGYRKATRVNAMRVLRELSAAGFFSWSDVLEGDDQCNGGLPRPKAWKDIPPAAKRALTSVKIKRKRIASTVKDDATCWEIEDIEFKGPDKNAALDKLCKHLGITKDGAALEAILAKLAEAERAEAKLSGTDGGGS